MADPSLEQQIQAIVTKIIEAERRGGGFRLYHDEAVRELLALHKSDNQCTHPNCYGEPCKMLTPAELEPSPEDIALAQQLLDEGWLQTSAKYRTVARLPADFPKAINVIRPEWIGTEHGVKFTHWWNSHRRMAHRSQEAITRELTVKQFRAFKKLGGQPA